MPKRHSNNPATILTPIYKSANDDCAPRMRFILSNENAENVVKPPQKPVAKSNIPPF